MLFSNMQTSQYDPDCGCFFRVSTIAAACLGLMFVTAAQAQQNGLPDVRSAAAVQNTQQVVEASIRTDEGDGQLPVVQITAEPVSESLGEMRLDRAWLDALPKGNGDITSVLKIHPGVQFDSRALQSTRQGEIKPADISINGAKFYENAYQLDGMGVGNHLDPASATENMPHKVSGSAFGMAIDSSLICDVTVRDANVPVEYGGFTGGVIDSRTCEPKRSFGGKISYQTTRSSWMRAHIDDGFEERFEESTDNSAEPHFTKHSWRLALEGRPSDKLGLIGSFVRTQSSIPLKAYLQSGAVTSPQNDLTETRRQDNYFVKAFYHPDPETDLDVSVLHAPGEEYRYINSWKNSGWRNILGGQGVNVGLTRRTSMGTLSQRLSWTRVEGSRGKEESPDTSYWWLASAEKNWAAGRSSAVEGGRGPQNQRETTATWQLKFDWNPLTWGAWTHRFQTGLELSRGEAYYERPTPFVYYEGPRNTSSCRDAAGKQDFTTCSLVAPYAQPGWNGQFFSSRGIYRAGKISVSGMRKAMFIQDEMDIGNLRLRLGLRYQDDQLASKPVIAPRLAAFWDVHGDMSTSVEAGLNRYYAQPMYAYELVRGRRGMLYYETRDSMNAPWRFKENYFDFDGKRKLELPYDDEAMLGLTTHAGPFKWGLKWVGRKGRKQVALYGENDPVSGQEMRYYGNIGKSSTNTLSLTVQTTEPLKWQGTRTDAMLVLDRTRSSASNPQYNTWLMSAGQPELIRYNGTVMALSDRPVDNFIRPWTARLAFNTEIPAAHLKWGNFFRYRAPYSQVTRVGSYRHEGRNIGDYAPKKFGGAWVWDSSLTWSAPVKSGQEAFVTASVFNITNRKVPVYDSGKSFFGTLYEAGRQFWLEVGYKF